MLIIRFFYIFAILKSKEDETVFYIDFACPAYNVCHGSARGDYAAIGYD